MKAKRHAKLLELIHNNDIYTQEDLMRHLQSVFYGKRTNKTNTTKI